MTDTETRKASDLITECDAVTYGYSGSIYTATGWYDAPLPENGESITMSDLSDGDTLVVIPNTAWGDYGGSTVERSNCRAIREDYPEDCILATGGYGSETLLIRADSDIPADMFDRIVELRDYPLWCDEDHTSLEMELEEEAWDSYGQTELRSEVLNILAGPTSDAFDAEDMLDPADMWSLYRLAAEATNTYPYCEDAVSCVLWTSRDGVPEYIADHIIAEYAARPECVGQMTLGETA